MHTLLIAISGSDNWPDYYLDEHTGSDIDYYTWIGEQDTGLNRGWLKDMETYITESERTEDDKEFILYNGEAGLAAAPRLETVDLDRLLVEYKPGFVIIDGTFFQEEGWCRAHKCMEKDPDFLEDVRSSLDYAKKHEDNLRVWFYDVHI
jgi:hypothetical protein